MNQKELNELRRRFRLDKNNFSRVYGCYVNSNREIIAWGDTSMGLMRQEEQEMYLGLLKKALSGGLGRSLINIEFSTAQVAGSDEHPPLFADMLRTVAEANPDTPLIVEIKSRSEYKHTYLEELCRATIAELKTYPGPYCIESFDPRVVGIVRRQAPGLLRGQLADSYRSYRKTGAHPVPAFVFSHCLGNFLGRPDFIAWCPEKRNWAVRLCARLGAMMVMWTALPEHDTRKLEAENDAVIFQWYAPKQQYK